MRRRRLTVRLTTITSAVIALLVGRPALGAEHAGAPAGKPALCGVVERAAGQAELIDPSRTELIEAVPSSGVPCGSWASVGETGGSLILRLKQGFTLRLGPGSFLQVNEGLDQVTLLKGQVMAETEDSSGELSVITPNGRARLRRGGMFVIYSQGSEETQVIALKHRASLENRFQVDARQVVAKAGEATSLNVKLLRVNPSTPRAVAVAALKQKFLSVPVSEKEQKQSLHAAHARGERIFPVAIESQSDPDLRKPASVGGRDPASYERHAPDPADQKLRRKLREHSVAGAPGEESLLFPGKGKQARGGTYRKRTEPIVEDESVRESQEKRRILEELSRVRTEE